MIREIWARGAFYWLRAPRNYADFSHEQWIMAGARLFLGICFFIAVKQADAPFSGPAGTLLLLYSIYSLGVYLALRLRPHSSPYFHIAIHCADILWAAHLALVIEWPGISFILFFFLLISSKMRWGFWEAQMTGIIFSFLFLFWEWVYQGILPVRPGTLQERLLEALLYCVMALGIGLMAESKVLRMERSATAAIIQSIRPDKGLQSALQTVCNAGMALFRPTQILVVTYESDKDRTTLFRAAGTRQGIQSSVLSPDQRETYFFPPPAPSWLLEASRRTGTAQFRCTTIASGKTQSCATDCGVPDAFLSSHPLRRLLATALPPEDGISVRTYIIDPSPWFGGAAGLRFLDRAARQTSPTLMGLFKVERMKTSAEAEAHRRVARELHDGAIQSLSSISLQLDELWRRAGPALTEEAGLLAEIQKNVREEIASLREFTTELRSLDLDSDQLPGYLAQLMTKFQFDNEIDARFVSDADEVQLRSSVCIEVARIAQEVLVNVRKHSGAGKVLMRFSRRDGNYILTVIDNGRGFAFSGRRTHEELLASGEGPAIIMERAREIQAEVEIESVPGSGSSIEIRIPSTLNIKR